MNTSQITRDIDDGFVWRRERLVLLRLYKYCTHLGAIWRRWHVAFPSILFPVLWSIPWLFPYMLAPFALFSRLLLQGRYVPLRYIPVRFVPYVISRGFYVPVCFILERVTTNRTTNPWNDWAFSLTNLTLNMGSYNQQSSTNPWIGCAFSLT